MYNHVYLAISATVLHMLAAGLKSELIQGHILHFQITVFAKFLCLRTSFKEQEMQNVPGRVNTGMAQA